MASGSRRLDRIEKTSRRVLGLPRGVVVLALCSLVFASAAATLTFVMRKPAFTAALSAVDASLAAQDLASAKKALKSACRYADGTDSWLSILKRARTLDILGEGGLYLKTAELALRKEPKSEPIAASAAHAYLRNGKADEAAALFIDQGSKSKAIKKSAVLSPAERPTLWAEAFLCSNAVKDATTRDYASLAEILDEGTPYLGAVVLSLAAHDLVAAKYWIQRALDSGATAPLPILWDCGLYTEILASPQSTTRSDELAVLGDTAWKLGKRDVAREYWSSSIASEPLRSWKCYAALALSSDSQEQAESYWERMRAAFLAGPRGPVRDAALRAYVVHLAAEGKDAEALRYLEGVDAAASASLHVLKTALRAKTQPEGRALAEFAALDQLMPNESEVIGARLWLLAERGRTEELVQAYESAKKRGVQPNYGWFFEAWCLTARGMIPQAAEVLLREGGDESGPAAAFALGTIRTAQSQVTEAAELFQKAASSAADGKTRAAALKAKGRALQAAGDQSAAAAAYRAAALADSTDAEAAVLARSLGLEP